MVSRSTVASTISARRTLIDAPPDHERTDDALLQRERHMAIDSVAKLRAVYRPPRARSGLKVLDHLDVHCRNFLALSPLCVISSARADGRADASPRGDLPGSLAHVLDDKTLLLPDRPGNRQLDTLTNLVERPYAGLVFFVPGWNETLRINGRVEIVDEREFLAPLAIPRQDADPGREGDRGRGLSPLRQGAHPGTALGTGRRGSNAPGSRPTGGCWPIRSRAPTPPRSTPTRRRAPGPISIDPDGARPDRETVPQGMVSAQTTLS